MATIAENLSLLQQTKNDIKTAIESKGQDLTSVPFTQYANKITNIGNETQVSDNIVYSDVDNGNETSITLSQLQQVKNDIKNAIENKGQDLTGVPFTGYANKIMNIVIEQEPSGTVGLVYTGLNSSGSVTTDETAIVAYMIGDGTTTAGNGYAGTDTNIIIPATYNNLPVTTIGARAFQRLAGLTSIQIPASVTTIGAYAFHSVTATITFEEGSGISGLGNYAFFGCSGLTSINLVEGLTEIPQTAFYNCDLLTSITIPSTVTSIKPNAFEHCNNLGSVEIPEGVTTIGNYAFYTCYGLTSITIPSTVTSIGTNAFASCRLLTEMTLLSTTPPTLNGTNAISSATTTIYVPFESLATYQTATNWSNFASIMVGFGEPQATEGLVYTGLNSSGSVTTDETAIVAYMIGNNKTTAGNGYAGTDTNIIIPSTYNGKPVTQIGRYSFRNLTTLTTVLVPDSVTTIGAYAFRDCENLAEINLPESVTTIGDYAFNGCTSLTEINFPDNLTSIGNFAFRSCTGLAEINIPNNLKSIGNYAFNGCTSLTEIDLSGIIDLEVFGNSIVSYCSSLTQIILPDYLTSIGNSTFYGCTSLTEINIPDSVTTIGNDLFVNCTSLTEINIPEGVTTIGSSAFKGCTSLTSIEIPSGVTSIGNYALKDCTKLTSMTLNPTTPPTLTNTNAISTATTTIRVPQSSLLTYQAATNWSNFASIMTGF